MSTPSAGTVTLWRSVVSSCYHHPTMLLHDDLSLFRELFLEMGADLQGQDCYIRVPLDETKEIRRVPRLRPLLPQEGKFQLVFGQLDEYEIDPVQQIAIIKNYTLGEQVVQSVQALVNFFRTSPNSLFDKDYGFVYDFMVRIGVLPNKMEEFIKSRTEPAIECQTKLRRSHHSHTNHAHGRHKIRRLRFRKFRHCRRVSELASSSSNATKRKIAEDDDDELDESAESEDAMNNDNDSDLENGGRLAYTKRHKVDGDDEAEWNPGSHSHRKPKSTALNGNWKKPGVSAAGQANRVNECPICGSCYTRRSGMNQHIRNIHGIDNRNKIRDSRHLPKDVKCELCGLGFVTKEGLRKHRKKKHPERTTSEPPTPAAAALNPITTPSIRLRSPPEVALPSQVNTPETIENGESQDNSPKVFTCSLCGWALKSRSGLTYHWKHSHPTHARPHSSPRLLDEFKKVKCRLCDWKFMTDSGLRYHMKTKHIKTSKSKSNIKTPIKESKTGLDDSESISNSNGSSLRDEGTESSQSSDENSNNETLTAAVASPASVVAESEPLLPPTTPITDEEMENGDQANSNASRKKKRTVSKAYIPCPAANCPILFTRRSALFCHFRNKHPDGKLPLGINYQGRMQETKRQIESAPRTQSPQANSKSNRTTIPRPPLSYPRSSKISKIEDQVKNQANKNVGNGISVKKGPSLGDQTPKVSMLKGIELTTTPTPGTVNVQNIGTAAPTSTPAFAKNIATAARAPTVFGGDAVEITPEVMSRLQSIFSVPKVQEGGGTLPIFTVPALESTEGELDLELLMNSFNGNGEKIPPFVSP